MSERASGPSAQGTSGPIGFVGLGDIGGPMARRLLGWPDGLHVHDLAPERAAELEGAGAAVASSIADLARKVTMVCVMVRDDDQVRAVLTEILAAAHEDLIVAVHSTVAPHTPRELADVAMLRGVRLVDAPVSGGAVGAAQGSLAIMVGGSEQVFDEAGPALRLMGSHVVHAGPVGAGTAMKLARNLLHFVSFTAAAEAQRLAEAAGVDLVALGKVVRHTDRITGGPGALMHRRSTAPLAPDDAWFPILDHVRALGEKDLRSAVELAEGLGVDVPLARRSLTALAPGLGLPTGHSAPTVHDEDHHEDEA